LVQDVYKRGELAQSADVKQDDHLDVRCRTMLMSMARMADIEGSIERKFAAMWKTREAYASHLAKRQREEVASSEFEYAEKTFNVIANSNTMVLAVASNDFATGKLQIEADGWIVPIGNDGHVVTSYRYMPDKQAFLDRHIKAGDITHEYTVDEEIRKILGSVFNRS
jgi:hypothetical protein